MNASLIIFISSAVGLACAFGQMPQPDQPKDPMVKTLRVYSTWTTFFHPRHGYELPIPPGVSALGNPEAADKPRFQSADRNFVMSAWGGIASDLPSKVIAAQWEAAQGKVDRKITYQRRGKTWFVVSGTDVRGIEFYEKFSTHGQHVAFLDITFPRSRMAQYERWVEQIEDGFRPVALRDGPPVSPAQLSRDRAEDVMEEPSGQQQKSSGLAKTAPAPKSESKPTEPTPKKLPEAETTARGETLPTAEKVAGKPGFVYSPFSENRRLVDVVDVPAGTKVKCPYTMKIFRVP